MNIQDANNRPPSAPMSAMARKLAGIRHFREGAEVQEIVNARVDFLQNRLDEQAGTLAGILEGRRREVKEMIATSCDEIDAMNPCEVVKERLTEGAQTVQRAKEAQQALFSALRQGEEKLERERQERIRLETLLRDYQESRGAYNPNAIYEQGIVSAGQGICNSIANIQEPVRR